jgi:hypothetical protein
VIFSQRSDFIIGRYETAPYLPCSRNLLTVEIARRLEGKAARRRGSWSGDKLSLFLTCIPRNSPTTSILRLAHARDRSPPRHWNQVYVMLPQRQRLRELEAHESAVQGPSRSGLERLRLSWGSRRRTEGQAQRDVSTWALYEGGH